MSQRYTSGWKEDPNETEKLCLHEALVTLFEPHVEAVAGDRIRAEAIAIVSRPRKERDVIAFSRTAGALAIAGGATFAETKALMKEIRAEMRHPSPPTEDDYRDRYRQAVRQEADALVLDWLAALTYVAVHMPPANWLDARMLDEAMLPQPRPAWMAIYEELRTPRRLSITDSRLVLTAARTSSGCDHLPAEAVALLRMQGIHIRV